MALLVLLATASIATFSPQIQPTQAAPTMMTGINYMSSGNAWAESDTTLRADFARFSNDGIKHLSVRIMWSTTMPTASGLSTTALNNLKRVLTIANDYGIKVNLDFWTQFGYTLGYPTSWAGKDYYSILSQPYKGYYLNYMATVINQVKSSPAIESYSILNEPYYDSNTQSSFRSAFQTLIKDAADTVKANKLPNQDVICRFALSYTPGSGKYDESVYDNFNVISITEYLDPSNPSDTKGNGRWSYWDNTVSYCKRTGKPLVVIEFGDNNANQEHNRLHYELSLEKFAASGVVERAYSWAWQTRSATSELYNIYSGSAPRPAYYELAKYPASGTIPTASPTATPRPTTNPTATPRPTITPTPTTTPRPTPTPTTPATPTTQVLQDGLESGTLNIWTATRITSGETIGVTTSTAYAGTRSAQFTTNGQGGSELSFAYKTLTSANTVNAQCYFKLTQNGLIDSGDRIKIVELRAGSTIIASAGLWQKNGATYWWMETRDGTSWTETVTTPVTVNTSNWFNLELNWASNSITGSASLRINGALVYQVTNADTDNYGSCSQVRVGLPEAYNCAILRAYVDNVVISAKA